MFFRGGDAAAVMEGQPREKNHLRVCANELIKLTTFFSFFFLLNAKQRLSQVDELLILFLLKSPLIGAVRLLHRAVSASSHSPSAAHTLAHLTQEILKTVCYFCLIIHPNRTSYTEPTRSAANSSNVYLSLSFFFISAAPTFSGMVLLITVITLEIHFDQCRYGGSPVMGTSRLKTG